MSELFIMNGILIFIFIVLYLSFTFTQKLSKRNTLFGVHLDEKYKKDPAIQKIVRRFSLQSLLIFLITSSLSLAYLNIKKDLQNPLFVLVPLLVQFGLYFMITLFAFKQVKSFKLNEVTEPTRYSKTIIDTAFMDKKSSLRRLFILLYSIPICITLSLAVYTFYKYPSLPEQIPTHWNYLGQVDAWTEKSYLSVLFPVIMHLFVMTLLIISTYSVFASRTKLNPEKLQTSMTNALNYLKGTAVSIYLIALFIGIVFWSTTLAQLQNTSISPMLLWSVFFGIIIFAGVVSYISLKYNKQNNIQEPSNDYSPQDDDRYWLWGFLYNNPNDPSLMVEKRYGIGWTLNVGNKAGKVLLIFLLLFIAGVLVISFTSQT